MALVDDLTVHRQLDILFVSESPIWPLDQGFRIRGLNMAKALKTLGVRVGAASHEPMPDNAPADVREMALDWPDADESDVQHFHEGWSGKGYRLRMRLANHHGRDLQRFAGIMPLIETHRPAAVIGLGQHSPLMLRALEHHVDTKRVWYAADELVSHQLSMLRGDRLSNLPHRMRLIGLYGGLENLFVRHLEGAIGVSPPDTRMLRWLAGPQHATTVRNGMDVQYFRPPMSDVHVKHKQIVFWGRMDFEPNIDAVCWFVKRVWPVLKALCPGVRFNIVGKNPTQRVLNLADHPGIAVLGAVDDIRPYAHGAAITVLPMRCGKGIKNKLLEAAAMGRPMVASRQAIKGLQFDRPDMPLMVCDGPDQWIEAICRLWADDALMHKLGADARKWVVRNHSWDQAARSLLSWLETLPGTRRGSIIERQDVRQPEDQQSTSIREAA